MNKAGHPQAPARSHGDLDNQLAKRNTRRMAKILERIRTWRRRHAESEAAQSDLSKDWKYQGKSFRASEAGSHNALSNLPPDEGRPRH